jgi:hypothetical protein
MKESDTNLINLVIFALCVAVLGANSIAAIEGRLPFGPGWAKTVSIVAFAGAVISYLKIREKANVR